MVEIPTNIIKVTWLVDVSYGGLVTFQSLAMNPYEPTNPGALGSDNDKNSMTEPVMSTADHLLYESLFLPVLR